MNFKKLTNKKNKGFTLVEILVVILILGILIVALIPRISAAMDKAKETQIKTDFRTFSTATESVMREYSGFAGVPMVAEDGRLIETIGEAFWADGLDVQDAAETPVTVALIQAVNRYLETNYQFDPNVYEFTVDANGKVTRTTELNKDFGRSAAVDPWKQPYEIYFVARNKDANLKQSLSSDKIYITSSGKTNNTDYADYTLLCQYKAGEVRTATVGFAGESYDADWDYVLGQANGRNYVCLNDLFEYDSETPKHDLYFRIQDDANPGEHTLFQLGMLGKNNKRLSFAMTDETSGFSGIIVENNSDLQEAHDAVASWPTNDPSSYPTT